LAQVSVKARCTAASTSGCGGVVAFQSQYRQAARDIAKEFTG
jgi:hypothetical protein